MAHDDFPISEKYYTPITCFLTFNLCAVLGNLIPSILRFVRIILDLFSMAENYRMSFDTWIKFSEPLLFHIQNLIPSI